MHYGRLMLDVAGLSLTSNERETLRREQVGGLILFSRNYQSKAQLAELVADIRDQNQAIVIAVDQEGGRVQRFREQFVALPPMHALHHQYQTSADLAIDAAREMGWLMASEITAMDIDISFAPVLDLHWAHSEIIGSRSLGAEQAQVSALAHAYILGMSEAGMCSTGKHFPGHGWVAADSHLQVATDERSFAQIAADDLQPFISLIGSGLNAVMPAHVIYSQVDASPAGFSRHWLQQVLRTELNFNGVIFSDDLNMHGACVAQEATGEQFSSRAAAALAAGCDTVLMCNNPAGALEVLNYLDRHQVPKSQRLGQMRLTLMAPDSERFERASAIAAELVASAD